MSEEPEWWGAVAGVLEEVAEIGPGKLAFRAAWELHNRSGLRAITQPVGVVQYPDDTPPASVWWQSFADDHWFSRMREDVASGRAGDVIRSCAGDDGAAAVIDRADGAIAGRIRCFSHAVEDFGSPIDWHLNPRTGARWPRIHFARALEHEDECGDVKWTWEANRFPHLYDLVRAYALTHDEKYPAAFARQLEGWEEANPFRAGVNWASGQELAIRMLAWTFGVATMGADPAFGDEAFRRWIRLMYWHALHIEANLGFARCAVPNNHLLAEALALYLVGRIFPTWHEAGKWRRRGAELVEDDCIGEQFYDDGGYCQASHTYHRLALHYLLWFDAIAAPHGPGHMPEKVRRVAEASGELLAAQANADGRLPNFGPNDGSLLVGWTECDYTDFRPVLGAIGASVPAAGRDDAWREEAFWFHGELPDAREFAPTSQSFPETGLHVLRRSPGTFAVLRCGTPKHPWGHADQMHVDVWFDGRNVALDAGSYLYNDELRYHDHFTSAVSHNTVTIDGDDQATRRGRFTFSELPRAHVDVFESDRVEGTLYAWADQHVEHQRSLQWNDGAFEVEDRFVPGRDEHHDFRLHWLLCHDRWIDERPPDAWILRGDVAKVAIHVEGADIASRTLTRAAGPVGAHSRYYGRVDAAASAALVVRGAGIVRLRTRFEPASDTDIL